MCLQGNIDQYTSFEAYQDFNDGTTVTLYRHAQTILGAAGLVSNGKVPLIHIPVSPFPSTVGCAVGDPGDLGSGAGGVGGTAV
jgi:hypothetical protein